MTKATEDRRPGNSASGQLALLLACALLPAGCRSAFIAARVENHSASAIKLIEVDYPSASFGIDSLAAGGTYSYRFKLQDSGRVRCTFTDASGRLHSSKGPELHSGQQGTLTVLVGPADEVTWQMNLSTQK